ncbi:MAG: hypothetical protein LBG67_04040 [Campylobacteraceae bacterium]|nr:hypothetical protein [Campylobacteraceae bacterium]
MKSYLEILIHFLAGASWALAIIFFFKLFFLFLPFGFSYAFLAGIVGFVIGLFLVVLIELFSLQVERTKEMKKQTKLLEEIANRLSKND